MSAVKGIFQDENGDYTIHGEPDFKLAREIMHGDEYHKAKIRIMKPLDDFYKAFESRTKQRVNEAKVYVKKLEFFVNVAVLFSTIMLVVSFFVILFRIIYSIQSLRNIMLELSNNNTNVEIPKTQYNDEISDMLSSVEVFKENTKTLITREHQLEVAVNEAKSANHAKSAFLARMSHELRTPLNAILGFTSILKKSKNTSNKEKENLNVISKSANYLLGLINEILELSKIEAGKIEIKKSDFSFENMLDEVVSIIDQRAKSNGCKFKVNKSVDVPDFIYSDEQRLKQVLINLLSNSVKFTKNGSITLVIYAKMNKLFFEIHDTGIGIEQKNLEIIFKPFERIKTQNYNKNGTGLGLAITKELISLFGGNIYVKSEVNVGTSFYFSIEFEKSSAQKIKKQEPIQKIDLIPSHYDYNILVVDDILENRDYLSQLLEHYGFTVIQASDGFEALDIFEKHKIDLLLIDTLMHGISGFETIEKIRIKDKKIPILSVSANVFEEDKLEAQKVGANGFLAKPIDEEQLFVYINSYLDVKLDEKNITQNSDLKQNKIDEKTKLELIEAINKMDDETIDRISNKLDESLKNKILTLKDEFKYHEIILFLENI
jgi:signal transduction histidine kinase/DNA-binding response OmpR family regulator